MIGWYFSNSFIVNKIVILCKTNVDSKDLFSGVLNEIELRLGIYSNLSTGAERLLDIWSLIIMDGQGVQDTFNQIVQRKHFKVLRQNSKLVYQNI